MGSAWKTMFSEGTFRAIIDKLIGPGDESWNERSSIHHGKALVWSSSISLMNWILYILKL
jgi:hypothetical protein